MMIRFHHVIAGISFSLLAACSAASPDSGSEEDVASHTEDALGVWQWSPNTPVPVVLSEMSPALATLNGSVYMVHSAGTDGYGVTSCPVTDHSIYWTKYNGSSWSADVKIPNQLSAYTPSLAAFNGHVYMMHSGNATPNDVWMSRFDTSSNSWQPNVKLGFQSIGAPAIAALNGKLYIIRVNPGDSQLHVLTMDTSETISGDTALAGMTSSFTPSATVMNGRLYIAYNHGQTIQVASSLDGLHWSANAPNGGFNGPQQTVIPDSRGNYVEPAIAAYGGYLHMIHKEPNQGDAIWWSYSQDGINWSVEAALPNQDMYTQAALAPLSNKLLLVHPSTTADHCPAFDTDERVWFSTFQ